MNFNKEIYKQEKARVIELIKKTHDWQNTEGFIADGIINPEVYERERIKILVILAETYGYDGNGETDIEDQPNNDFMGISSSLVQTPRKMASLLWLLLNSLDRDSKIDLNEFSESELFKVNNKTITELQKVMSRIAWINVKKASQPIGTDQDYVEIYNNAFRNEEILSIQLKSIAPDLVIVCSKPVIDSLYEMEIFGTGIDDKKNKIQKTSNGQRIINVNHPRYFRDWGYVGIYKIFETIYSSF